MGKLSLDFVSGRDAIGVQGGNLNISRNNWAWVSWISANSLRYFIQRFENERELGCVGERCCPTYDVLSAEIGACGTDWSIGDGVCMAVAQQPGAGAERGYPAEPAKLHPSPPPNALVKPLTTFLGRCLLNQQPFRINSPKGGAQAKLDQEPSRWVAFRRFRVACWFSDGNKDALTRLAAQVFGTDPFCIPTGTDSGPVLSGDGMMFSPRLLAGYLPFEPAHSAPAQHWMARWRLSRLQAAVEEHPAMIGCGNSTSASLHRTSTKYFRPSRRKHLRSGYRSRECHTLCSVVANTIPRANNMSWGHFGGIKWGCTRCLAAAIPTPDY